MLVSLGVQCTSAAYKKNIGKDSKSTPFQWIFSPPKFSYEMLRLLLDEKLDPEKLVREHFLLCDKKASCYKQEHYFESDNGNSLYNSKYNAIFPHDKLSEETVEKYTRRFLRLRDYILTGEDIRFLYISQRSNDAGNYTINGKEILKDVYYYLNKTYELVIKYNRNIKLVIFDLISEDDKNILHKDINLISISKNDTWDSALQEMYTYKHLF